MLLVVQCGRRQRRHVPLLCLDIESCLLQVRYHFSILLDLWRQRRVVDASFLANEVEAAQRGARRPTGVVDGVC